MIDCPSMLAWQSTPSTGAAGQAVSTTGLVDTKQQPGVSKRRQYSEASKRQMVAETQAPGASVSTVARRHDVNSNQLFRWRRQLLPKAVVESGTMVPVEIAVWFNSDSRDFLMIFEPIRARRAPS